MITIPIKLVFIYETAVCAVVAILIWLFRSKSIDSDALKENKGDHIDRLYFINRSDYHKYALLDWQGNPVEHLITFDEFYNKWLKSYISSCHDFTASGFLYDEGGSMGCDGTEVGFATREDFIKYQAWFRDQVRLQKSALQETTY